MRMECINELQCQRITLSKIRRSVYSRSLARLAVLLLATAPMLSADGFRNPPDGPRAIGRIGGHMAQIDDLTAIVHNPANLPDVVTAPNGQATLSVGYGSTKFTPPAGVSEESQAPVSYLPALFAAMPVVEDRCVLGLAVYVPFGRSVTWDENGVFRYTAPHYAALHMIECNPVVATRLTPSLSFAAGVGFAWSQVDYRQYVPWSMFTGQPDPDAEMRLDVSGRGWGANAAVAWTPAKGHRLAVSYRSAIKIDYDGDVSLDHVPAPAGLPPPLSGVSARSDVKTSIEFPPIASAAYGVELGNSIRLEAQVEWIGFSTFKTLDVDAGSNAALIPPTMREQNWENTWTFGVGADWRMTEAWTLRAGLLYLQSPVPDNTFTPFMADEDQPVLSLGVGFNRGSHAVDLACAVGLFDGRSIRDNANPAYNGDYDFQSSLLSLGYRVSF